MKRNNYNLPNPKEIRILKEVEKNNMIPFLSVNRERLRQRSLAPVPYRAIREQRKAIKPDQRIIVKIENKGGSNAVEVSKEPPVKDLPVKRYIPPAPRDTSKVTVVIGHRGKDRLKNLLHVISSFRDQTVQVFIIVVEQDLSPVCKEDLLPLVDKYIFTYSDRLYNRSWAFNCGVNFATTDYVLLHDNDLVAPPYYIEKSLSSISGYDALISWSRIKYLGENVYPSFNETTPVNFTWQNTQASGGSMLISRSFYLDIKGMDERFEGWGGEDNAFHDKAYKTGRLKRIHPGLGNDLLHLYHPASNRNHPQVSFNNKIAYEYRSMNAREIREYADNLGDVGDINKYKSPGEVIMKRDTFFFKRLHVIYDVVGWAYYHHAKAIQKFAPEGWIVTIGNTLNNDFVTTPPDIVYLLDRQKIREVSSQIGSINSEVKLVGFFSESYDWRGYLFRDYLSYCDHVIVINQETHSKLKCDGTSYITTGVDLSIFTPNDILPSKKKIKVLWCGSRVYVDIKGYKIIRLVANELTRLGMEFDINLCDSYKPLRNQPEMCKWYQTGTVFVCSSSTEGGPQTVLEAAACGVPLVTTQVGFVNELVTDKFNGVIVDRDVKSILSGINYAIQYSDTLVSNMNHRIKEWSWEIKAKETFQLFQSILERGRVLA